MISVYLLLDSGIVPEKPALEIFGRRTFVPSYENAVSLMRLLSCSVRSSDIALPAGWWQRIASAGIAGPDNGKPAKER